MRLVRLTILGETPSLKNQKRIGRGRIYNDPQIVKYQADFAAQVPAQHRNVKLGSKDAFVTVSVWLFHPDWRRDADVAIILDCLQLAGVIANDRWARTIHVYGTRIDATNPRAEIVIEEKDNE